MDLQKKIYNFILEYWKLIKKYTPIPADDDIDTWDNLIKEQDILTKKYKDDSTEYLFFKSLIVAWLDYLQSKGKEGKREG